MLNQNSTASLGSERIGTLLMQYSLPAIIATAASSIYNVIDRIFVGHGVGPLAISGLAITLPLMNITAAFGSLVGIGASTMVSIRLGQRDRKEAIHILGNAVLLNLIISILTTTIGLIFLDPILYAMGASKDTLPYAKEFMQIILIGNIFTHVYLGLNNIMRSSGYPRKAMITTLITVGINLILAPVFIFVFNWGIRGAALATITAQFLGTIWVALHFLHRHSVVRFLPGYVKLKDTIISDIFSIGLANFLMFICGSLVVILINVSLKKYGGDYAIGAFGIINSIMNLIAMVVLGLNQGMQPIAGFNFGAKQFDRVDRVFKLTLISGTAVTTFGFLISEIFPRQLAGLFTNSPELISLSASGLRLVFASFVIIGFQMVTSSFFQSIDKAKISITLSLTRQVIFLIPLVFIFSHIWGVNGVWMSMPASDFLASLFTLFMLKKYYGSWHPKSAAK